MKPSDVTLTCPDCDSVRLTVEDDGGIVCRDCGRPERWPNMRAPRLPDARFRQDLWIIFGFGAVAGFAAGSIIGFALAAMGGVAW